MQEKFKHILDQLNIDLYITDLDTHEILFMNRQMKNDYGLTAPEGKLCWQVLQKDLTSPCSFCRIPELKKLKTNEMLPCWHEESKVAGKIFENYDSLIEWDGKIVHMQQSYDVTDLLQLSEHAETDPLCFVYNRRKGKALLTECLAQINDGHSFLIALLDVDNLKLVNDCYSHAEGDFLLQKFCETIKNHLVKPDFMFRLSGDEFVIVMRDLSKKEGNRLLRSWRKETEKLSSIYHKPYPFSFSYGLSSISSKNPCAPSELIARADEQMYEEKLRRRKTKLLAENENAVPAKDTDEHSISFPSSLLYNALILSTDDFIYYSDIKTGIFHYPPALLNAFDLPGEIIENPLIYWKKIVHPDDWPAFYKSNMEIVENKRDSHSVEFRAKNRSGEYVWLKCRGNVIRNEYGEPSLFAGIMSLLGKRDKIDPLTQLPDYSEYLTAIKTQIEDNNGEAFALLILDVDDFRLISEIYERSYADKVLQTMARTLLSILPADTSLYRLDYDKFGLLIFNFSREEITSLYYRIQRRLMGVQEWRQRKLNLQVSAGCSLYPSDATAADSLYQYATFALQYAKDNGRNHMEFFTGEILKTKQRSLEIVRKLQEALAFHYQGLYLNYQPQVDGITQKIKGVEALMRFKDPEGAFISPAEFIPVMEEYGIIHEAGLWMVQKALTEGKEWLRMDPDFSISVNISAVQMSEKDFLKKLLAVIDSTGFPYQNLIVELTESCAVQNLDIFRDIFDHLRSLGIRVAMDDFGTGYSSLEVLKNSPIDVVKIDKSFVKDILNSKFDAAFISFVVTICHTVNIKVCLEGVETAEEYDFLKQMQLDYIQGYYFGRPMEPSAITKLLS